MHVISFNENVFSYHIVRFFAMDSVEKVVEIRAKMGKGCKKGYESEGVNKLWKGAMEFSDGSFANVYVFNRKDSDTNFIWCSDKTKIGAIKTFLTMSMFAYTKAFFVAQ